MPFVWIISFLAIFPALSRAVTQSDIETCNYYPTLNERLLQKSSGVPAKGCGQKGYLLNFGYYFCKEYVRTDAAYTNDGKRRLKSIRECLVRALKEKDSALTCQNAAHVGISSHVNCYLESGFCKLSKADAMQVYWTARSALMIPMAWNTFARVKIGCLQGRGSDVAGQ